MAFLRDMSDRFWNYVSPRKTQQRRDKPFKVPAIPIRHSTPMKSVDHREMSPGSRIKSWKIRTPSNGSVDETQLPPSPPTSAERPPTDYEGDTLIAGIEGSPISEESIDWDANEETMVADDDGAYLEKQNKTDPTKEKIRREEQGRELREAGWSEDAVFLFQKLGMRGFEPLMPYEWMEDFDSLPGDLFTFNQNHVYIESGCGSDYRAQLALSELFNLGGRARDAVLTKARHTPEYWIKQSVKRYNQWAMRDGNMARTWKNLSLFEIISCSKNTAPDAAEQKMTRKLNKLAGLWRDAFRLSEIENRYKNSGDDEYYAVPELPTLYGIIASHTVMAFVSYVPPAEEGQAPSLRMIAMFDFGQEGYDVWNSLAIAIFVIHCRNRMNNMEHYLPKPESVMEDDPDL